MKMFNSKLFLLFLGLLSNFLSIAQNNEYKIISDVPYYSQITIEQDGYIKERCLLNIYYPKNINNFPTIVWFHGGGLTGGETEIPFALKEKGFAVIGVNYRLSPKVKAPAYIEDAAAAVAWVFKNIKNYGGDTSLIFVAGYSAGGYITQMIGLDKAWLNNFNINANNIAGLISLSGQAITHFTIREERGVPGTQPIIDELAPLYHVRKDAPPLVLITGDRELELLGRYEENAYLMRMMKISGHTKTKLYKLDGYDHGMTEPAFPLMIKEILKITEEIRGKQ